MKKGFTIGLAFVLLAVLVGIGIVSCAPPKPAKVTVWCWDPNFNGASMKAAAAVYNKAHPNVTIDVVDIPQDIDAKIEAGLQANGSGLPDIALFQDFEIEKFIQNYPKAFVDLKAAGIDYSKFAQYKVGPMSSGKSIYGIPFDTGSTGFWLRTDMIKAAGLNPDDYFGKDLKWSDIVKLGVAVKAKTGKPLIAWTAPASTSSASWSSPRARSSSTTTAPSTCERRLQAVLAILKELNDKGLLYITEGWNDWVSAQQRRHRRLPRTLIWMVGTLKSKPENAGK